MKLNNTDYYDCSYYHKRGVPRSEHVYPDVPLITVEEYDRFTKKYYDEPCDYGLEDTEGVCGGSGKKTIKESKKCTTCNGKSKIYTYVGTYKFSQSEIDNYVNKNRSKIDQYNRTK